MYYTHIHSKSPDRAHKRNAIKHHQADSCNDARNLTYDSQNLLIAIQHDDAQNGAEYEYDGLGRRVKTIDNVGSTTHEYLYAGSTLIAEKVNTS